MRVLFICTGNTCRSQMAAGILESLRPDWEVFSAGVEPGSNVNENAVNVLNEWYIDISGRKGKHVKEFSDADFDYVITLCDYPLNFFSDFPKNTKTKLHLPVSDPFSATGTLAEVQNVYRNVRNELKGIIEKSILINR
jgi:arsenate reductase